MTLSKNPEISKGKLKPRKARNFLKVGVCPCSWGEGGPHMAQNGLELLILLPPYHAGAWWYGRSCLTCTTDPLEHGLKHSHGRGRAERGTMPVVVHAFNPALGGARSRCISMSPRNREILSLPPKHTHHTHAHAHTQKESGPAKCASAGDLGVRVAR